MLASPPRLDCLRARLVLVRGLTSPPHLGVTRRTSSEVLEAAVVPDHVVGAPRLLVLVQLALLAALQPGLAALGQPLLADLVVGDHGDGGVEGALHRGLEQQRHLDHGDLDLGAELLAPSSTASPTRGWVWDSSQRSSSGRSKTISATLSRSTSPPGATSGPQRSTSSSRTSSRSSRSWATRSVESVAAPARSKAASASDLPAPIPPVRPMKRVKGEAP